MQPPHAVAVAADLLLGPGHVVAQRPARRRTWTRRRAASRSSAHCEQRDLAGEELVAGVAGEVAELLVGHLPRGAPDDAVVGHHPEHGEVEESRQQLACRQVARRPEQHDHVRVDLRAGRRRIGGLAAVHDLGHAGRRTLSSAVLAPMIFGTASCGQLLQLGDPVGRLGQPLHVRPVRAEDHSVLTHEADDLVDVVLPERVDPDVAAERVDRVLGEVARHAPRRRAQLAEERSEELRAVLDRGDAHVGETVEQLLEDERGQPVVRGPLDGEHLDARALVAAATLERGAEAVRRVAVRRQPGVAGVHDDGDARFVHPRPERVELVGRRRERPAAVTGAAARSTTVRASWSRAHSSSRTASSTSARVM